EGVPIPRLHVRLLAVGAFTMLFTAIASAGPPPDLSEAARNADWTAVRELLESDAGADVDVRGRHGMTALLWASQANHVELARLLLEAGAEPNLGNRYGITPLWLAATNGSASLVEL